MANNKSATWTLGESVGDWFKRRLSEEFNKIPIEQRKTIHGNSLDPKQWLRSRPETSMVSMSYLYEIEESESLHISRKSVRDKLAKYLGYYGYPLRLKSDCSNEFYDSVSSNISNDFDNLVKSLPSFTSRCPFCTRDTNYFLGMENRLGKGYSKTEVKRIYLSSHNFKQFGAAYHSYKKGSFELEILICDECIVKYKKLFISPVSEILGEMPINFESKKLTFSKIAEILDSDGPSISKEVKGKSCTFKKEYLRKIIGLSVVGHLEVYDPNENFYKTLMVEAIKVAVGEMTVEEFVELFSISFESYQQDFDNYPRVDEGCYRRNSEYTPIFLKYDIKCICIQVSVKHSYTQYVRDMIYEKYALQTLLITLATPDDDGGYVELLDSWISDIERVC